jgi:hypothetical protein
MRAQKMREEAVEKERDEYFNIIRPVILMKARVEGEGEGRHPCTYDL